MAGSYRELKVWQRAMCLVKEIYLSTAMFPKSELYGLTAQMRRSAVSVPSNIAEGKGRFSSKELILFLRHARGSLLELETQILISESLAYLPNLEARRLLGMTAEVGRLLNGLVNAFQTDSTPNI